MHKVIVTKVSGGKKPDSNSPKMGMDPVSHMMDMLNSVSNNEEDSEEESEVENEDNEPYICVEVTNLEDKVKDKLVSFLEKLGVKAKVTINNTLKLNQASQLSSEDSAKEAE